MRQHHDEPDDRLIVRIVDLLIANALNSDASDIHIEPQKNALRIRYRIDGLLCEQDPLEATLALQIISRLKVLARINIVQRRVPQDGKFCFVHENGTIDVRLSTFPSLYGETVVLRLLDRNNQLISLDHLGFFPAMRDAFMNMLGHQHGLILVTGPTGSGKTTTLYSALAHINSPDKHIITLEDPVEYSVDGITQGHIDADVGFTFEKGIRAMLRQDPDILLVGEIRDRQTARIAIEAALTGHLVLSTLHTNDAPSAIIRLMDMGVEPFLINAALIGILAQRLVRVICKMCHTTVSATVDQQMVLKEMGLEAVDADTLLMHTGAGCSHCNGSGYKGRTGVFELLPITLSMRSLIVANPCVDDVYTQAFESGMQSLKYDALAKVCTGVTTLQEFMRVCL
jgi:type II secretory ATPase GspE/PulE/Tfp pilus assembly ATPase PilB-like protein